MLPFSSSIVKHVRMKNVTYLLEVFSFFSNIEYVCYENLVFLEGKRDIVINKETISCSLTLCLVFKEVQL